MSAADLKVAERLARTTNRSRPAWLANTGAERRTKIGKTGKKKSK